MVTVNVISFHANSKRRHLILEAGWNPALGAVRQRWFPPEDGDLESHKGQDGPEVGFEEISIDLPQAHFWITSGLASSRL
jgi:hypothetical protein